MKLNQSYIALAGLFLICTGCKSDDYADGSTPLGNAVYADAATTAPETRVTFKKTVSELDRQIKAVFISPVKAATTVRFAVDADAVADYNRRKGTDYALLDKAHYELSAATAEVEAGKNESQPLTVHFKGLEELEIDQTSLLPVTVSAEGMGQLEGSQTVYYLVKRSSAITTAANLTDGYLWVPSFETDEGKKAVNGLTALTLEILVNVNEFSEDAEISSLMGVEQYCQVRFGDTGFPRQQLQTQIGGTAGTKFPEADASKELQAGEWYHIAMTWDLTTTELKFYVNGTLQSAGNATWKTEAGSGVIDLALGGPAAPNARRFFVGYSYDPHRPLNGLVSQVRIWSVARSQEEIWRDMYDVENPESKPELRAYWKCDEGQGNTVKDWSQYGNDLVCLDGANDFEKGERNEGTLKWDNSIEIPQLNKE